MLRSAFVIILSIAFTCTGAGGAPPVTPIEITVIIPLSGPGAATGTPIQQGFQTLERYVNARGGVRGRPVKFAIVDDQTSPQISLQLFDAAAARGAQVVFGGAYSSTCKAVAASAAAKGPLFYCLSPALRPPKDSFVFSGYYYPLDLLGKTIAFFHRRGWNRLALLISTDASGQEVDSNLDTVLNRPDTRGMQIVAHEHFAPTEISVSAQVAKIAAARPQALVIWTGAGTAVALHAVKDANLDVPIATSPSLMVYSAMTQYADILPKQLYFGAGKWAAYPQIGAGPIKDELKRYFAAFAAAGIAPDVGQNLAWDPGLIVLGALRVLGPDATAEQLRSYIENLHGFPGTNGLYDFRSGDQRGLNPNDAIVTQWSPAAHRWVPIR